MAQLNVPHEILIGDGDNNTIKEQCQQVRITVFVKEQGFSQQDEIDHYDSNLKTTHILLKLASGESIGTVRCARPSEATFKLSRLAVLKEYRSAKFGQILVEALNKYATQQAKLEGHATCIIVCHSQIPVVAFYAKYGYEAEGDLFQEDGAPHQKMVARFPVD